LADDRVYAQRIRIITGSVVAFLAGVSLVSYAFNSKPLLRFGPWTTMAVHTASLFLIVATLTLSATPSLRALLAEGPGAVLLRRVLPLVTLIALVTGRHVLLGEDARSYDPRFAMSFAVSAAIATAAVVLWRAALSLRRIDARRAEASDELATLAHERAIERARHEADTRFRSLVESLTDAVSVFAAVRDETGSIVDFTWIYANEAAGATTGYPPEDLVGKRLLEVLPAHRDGTFAVYCDVVDNGTVYIDPALWYDDVWGDGQRRRRAFDVRASRVDDGFVVVSREVTAEREAEVAIRRSTERFRLILHTAPIGMDIVALDGELLEVNPAFCALTGYAAGEIIGRRVDVIRHPDESLLEDADAGRLLAGDIASYDVERRYLRKDGTERWGRVRVALLRDPNGAPEAFLRQVEDITDERAQASELARRSHQLEASNREIALLDEMGDLLQSCISVDEAYAVVASSSGRLFADHAGGLSIMKPTRDGVETVAIWNGAELGQRFDPEDCWALRLGRPHRSGPGGPRCAHLGPGATTCVCVPLIGQGETTGVLHLIARPNDDGFEDATIQLARTVSERVSMAIANLRLRDRLREMSIRDPLTGLFNRRYMEETLERELSRAERDGSTVSVLELDVDHFKTFNDTYGHAVGDTVLEEMGRALAEFFRGSDVVCRYGGEEFTVILPDSTLAAARDRAEALRVYLATTVIRDKDTVLPTPTVSCGISAFPDDGADPASLLRVADQALYAAKRAGRNCVVTSAGNIVAA
jgi:diguanylate cyclase (GGDEF)-like protein/PAS domain S-box-containing protein